MADAKQTANDRVMLVKSFAVTLELMRTYVSRANLGEGESAQEFRDFLDLCWLAAARLQEDLAYTPQSESVVHSKREVRHML